MALTLSQTELGSDDREPSESEPSLLRRGVRTGALALIVLAAGTLLPGGLESERLLRRFGGLAAPGPLLVLASLPGQRLSLLMATGVQWTAAAAALLLLLQLWLRQKPALLCRAVAAAFGCLVAAHALSTLA